jgi:AcrR family transcriptional regulator
LLSPPPAETARRPGRPRDARVDDAVLAATLELVGRDGLAGLTIDAVAAHAGVGKATIYRRWQSKEALLLDAWAECMTEPPVPDTGSLRADLEVFLVELLDALTTGRTAGALAQMVAAARTDAELGERYRRFVSRRRRRLGTVLRRAQERGELGPGIDVEAIQDLLVGPMFYRILVSGGRVDQHLVMVVIDVVLAGLAAGSAPH